MSKSKIKNFLLLSRALTFAAVFSCGGSSLRAQGRLILNGGTVVLAHNASLIIGNPDHDAIQRIGGGYISSESSGNRIVWAIGSGDGNTYTLPFGNADRYFPVSFKAASGTGSEGFFTFSTYQTPSLNSSDLPSGVTNMTLTSGDNSLKTIDRFWQIKPEGYSTAPTLSDLAFAYSLTELASPNTITEANLTAYRWNGSVQKWNDYIPVSDVNIASHVLTVASVAGSKLFDWWTLADATSAPLPVTLLYFTAKPVGDQVLTVWQTAMEQNSDHFEVWRSSDGQTFDLIGSVSAAGNSSGLLDYTFTDARPFSGVSYYKLKSVDRDGQFTWSVTEEVDLNKESAISLYPNPATSQITIISNAEILSGHPSASIYNIRGQRINTFSLISVSQNVDISTLASGVYQVDIIYGNQTRTIRFVKL